MIVIAIGVLVILGYIIHGITAVYYNNYAPPSKPQPSYEEQMAWQEQQKALRAQKRPQKSNPDQHPNP